MKMMVMIIILAIYLKVLVTNTGLLYFDIVGISMRTINVLINVLLDPNQGTTNICFSIMMQIKFKVSRVEVGRWLSCFGICCASMRAPV